MENVLDKLVEYLSIYGIKVLAAIIIFVVGRWLAKLISKIVAKIMIKSKVDPLLVNFAKNLIYAILLIFVVIAALNKLGIDTTSLAVIFGAAGLAIAFALNGTLGNFASGVMLIIFKPFKVGDFVEVSGKSGVVQEIQIFNTILHTPDNVRIIVPNSQVTAGSISNFTANKSRRIDLVIGVSYSDDLQKTKKTIETALTSDSRVLADPAYTIAVSELGDSSVNFVVRPWVKTADYWTAKFDLTEKIKDSLDKNGISIPFPQRDIHMIPQQQN